MFAKLFTCRSVVVVVPPTPKESLTTASSAWRRVVAVIFSYSRSVPLRVVMIPAAAVMMPVNSAIPSTVKPLVKVETPVLKNELLTVSVFTPAIATVAVVIETLLRLVSPATERLPSTMMLPLALRSATEVAPPMMASVITFRALVLVIPPTLISPITLI